jgi:hypothetical protein
MERNGEPMTTGTASESNTPPSAQPQSGPTLPQLSLPKGGGAIRGIDEKFSANSTTGAGSLNVQIAVSPGRSGFQPQLALTYNSGGGNGVFGMGWGLSLPSITRRTDKGIPQYRDSEEVGELSDIFLLSGAEDLVPCILREGNGAWRFDEDVRDGYRIKRYQPRIEGLFALIEQWVRLADGDIHWRSISRDNIVTLYGIDAASRIADPDCPAHIFNWLICGSRDDKGNAIVYDYAAEDARGVDLAKPSEMRRSRSANRYPKGIRYGNRTPIFLDAQAAFDSAQWMFEVVFDYAEGHYREHPLDAEGRLFAQASTHAAHDWQVRKDPFSSYRAGFEIRNYRLCRNILMFHHFPEELGVDSCLVRSTAVEFVEKPTGSFITRVTQRCHKRQDDERYLTQSLPPLDLTYTVSPLDDTDFQDFKLEEVSPDSLADLPGGIDGRLFRWLDLNAEGIPGILTEQGDTWFYKPNNGAGHFGATVTVKSTPAISALDQGVQVLTSVTGDGALDLVDLSPPVAGFHARTADSGWEGLRRFLTLPVRDWQDPNLRFVDLTGDGIADVLVTEDEALVWHPSLLAEGYGPGLRVRVPLDEELGPRVIFANPDQSIYPTFLC